MNDSVWLELADRVRDPEFAVELVRVLKELSGRSQACCTHPPERHGPESGCIECVCGGVRDERES